MAIPRSTFRSPRCNRRRAVVTLELILAVPVLLIVLLAVVEVGLILAASKHVEFASRLGAKLAAEIPRTGGPPDLGTFNLPTTTNNLKDRVDQYLVTAGYTNSCTVILEHNAVGVPNPVQIDDDLMPCPCDPDPVTPLPSSVPGPPPAQIESVRVTVCLPMEDNIPNCLATFGFDLADCTIRHSTVWRYEGGAPAVGSFGLTVQNSPVNGSNVPLFSLTNSGPLPIIGVTVTIGNTAYNFDAALPAAGTTPGVVPTLVTPDTDGFGGTNSDQIVFTYTGFTMGRTHTFDADIDLDGNPFGGPDFRTVLFNNGAAPNSVVTVTFQGGGMLSITMPDVGVFQPVYNFSAP
jgi:hypothetical protein